MAIILVVDDHPLNRHFLATLLSYHGHQIHEATDGVEALDSIRRQRPDLIIADVVMPRMDGFALVRNLRDDASLADIPFVFYTASYREVESRAIARAAGVEHLITKPSDPEVILATVEKALGPNAVVPAARRKVSAESSRQYVERLQLTSIRMSTLIDLNLDLNSERDPDRLLHTACRAVRTIFDSQSAAIVLIDEEKRTTSWVDGPVDAARMETLLVGAIATAQPSVRNVSGASDALVQVMREAMPDVTTVLLVPMQSALRTLYGWIVLGKTGPEAAYSTDDERLALAAASEIRAIHENLTLYLAQRQQAVQIAEQLNASRQDLAALFDGSPLPIVSFDRDRLIRAWNRAAERTFGWSAEEVIGKPYPLVPPDQHDEFEILAAGCLAGATLTDVEVQRIRKDGARIDASVSMAPLYDAAGVARGFVSILNDVTARKRAESELRSSEERLRALSARVMSIQEDERTRIARELHDDLAQLLAAIKIEASRLVQDVTNGATPPPRVLQGIVPLIDTTLDAIRRIVSELRPSRIGEMGLVAAIEKKLNDFQQRTDIECELSIRPEELEIRDDIAAAVFRILEEALTNVASHSGATRAEVRLRQQPDELLLEVRDNGRGIRDAEKLAENAYGIIGMNERAYLFGGSVTITGVEGRGTIVAARIPLNGRPGERSE